MVDFFSESPKFLCYGPWTTGEFLTEAHSLSFSAGRFLRCGSAGPRPRAQLLEDHGQHGKGHKSTRRKYISRGLGLAGCKPSGLQSLPLRAKTATKPPSSAHDTSLELRPFFISRLLGAPVHCLPAVPQA